VESLGWCAWLCLGWRLAAVCAGTVENVSAAEFFVRRSPRVIVADDSDPSLFANEDRKHSRRVTLPDHEQILSATSKVCPKVIVRQTSMFASARSRIP
jgi:hypothetical protein